MELVKMNDQEVKLLRSEVGALQATVSSQNTIIEQLQSNINSTEQYSRRLNLEIHGIPYTSREDLSVTTKGLAEKLNICAHPAEVVARHRLRSKQEGAAPVLDRFSTVSAKRAAE